MTPISDMVDSLVLAGASPQAIAVAVRHAETSRATSRATLSETPGAKRSRRWRKKRKENQGGAKANDVAAIPETERHAQRHGETDRCDLSFFSESFSKKEATEKKESTTVIVEGRASKRGTRIPDDFQPDEKSRAFVLGLGIDPAWLRDEFFEYWSAVPGWRGLKLDWQKTYRNRAREIASRRKGSSNGSVIEATDRLRNKLAAFEQSDPALLPDVRNGSGTADVRMLPAQRRG